MKVSIVTSVWNRAGTIGQAIDSVSAQSYGDIEHVIVDGASSDGTVAEIEARLDRGQIRFTSEPDTGIYDAINKGIARASGDVIGLMHSDDFYADAKVIADVVAAFAPGVQAVYGDLDYVAADNPDRVVRHWVSGAFTPAKLRRGWMPPHPTLFLRREMFERLGSYDTSFRIAADYDAILRYFTAPDLNPAYLPRVLMKMRVGGESNRSLSRIMLKSREDLRALRRNRIGGLGALAVKNVSKLPQFLARG